MSKLIDLDLRDRAAADLAVALDITYKEAEKLLEVMDQEVKKF